MSAKQVRVQPDVGNLFGDETSVLPRRHTLPKSTLPGENKLTRLLARESKCHVCALFCIELPRRTQGSAEKALYLLGCRGAAGVD
jgi:hypothetical protein